MKAVVLALALLGMTMVVCAQEGDDIIESTPIPIDGLECGSLLGAVYKSSQVPGCPKPPPGATNCSFIHIQARGRAAIVRLVNPRLTLCTDVQTGRRGNPQTAVNFANRTMWWYSGVGGNIWQITGTAGAARVVATLPAFNTNFTIGLEYTNGSLYFVTQDTVFLVAGGTLTPVTFLKPLSLPNTAVVASYKGILHFLHRNTLTKVNPLTESLDPVVIDPLVSVRLAEFTSTGQLLVVESDKLYSVNPATGASTAILALPTGIVAMSVVNKSVYLADATKIYVVDLNTNKIVSSFAFNTAPLFGNFEYFG